MLHKMRYRLALDLGSATDHDKFDYDLIKASAKLIVDSHGRYLTSANHIVKA
jgi:UDP-N-acetyl-D-glucosamine dehydrogenase